MLVISVDDDEEANDDVHILDDKQDYGASGWIEIVDPRIDPLILELLAVRRGEQASASALKPEAESSARWEDVETRRITIPLKPLRRRTPHQKTRCPLLFLLLLLLLLLNSIAPRSLLELIHSSCGCCSRPSAISGPAPRPSP